MIHLVAHSDLECREQVGIQAGDLIAYLRREKDNDVNAATEFRHLQRLK